MEWLMAEPRISAIQKQIPFVSLRSHRHGICIFWRPVLCRSSAWLVGVARCGGNRLVAHLSQRSLSFRRYGGNVGWTGDRFFGLGTAPDAGRPTPRDIFSPKISQAKTLITFCGKGWAQQRFVAPVKSRPRHCPFCSSILGASLV